MSIGISAGLGVGGRRIGSLYTGNSSLNCLLKGLPLKGGMNTGGTEIGGSGIEGTGGVGLGFACSIGVI